MIFILKEEYEMFSSEGQSVGKIPIGTRLSSIDISYVPKGSKIHPFGSIIKEDLIKSLKKDYLIIYCLGYFLAIDKNDCDVPFSDGWMTNL